MAMDNRPVFIKNSYPQTWALMSVPRPRSPARLGWPLAGHVGGAPPQLDGVLAAKYCHNMTKNTPNQINI